MRLHVDESSDALYFRLSDEKIVESEEVQPGIILDFNEQGQFVAIEILGVKSRIPNLDMCDLKFDVA